MKKIVLFALIGLGGLLFGQSNEAKLKQLLEDDKNQTLAQFDIYAQKKIDDFISKNNPGEEEISELQKVLSEQRKSVASVYNGIPYFLKSTDTDQIKNSNVDIVQEGKISGLQGNFTGKGVHISVFDGGRALETHIDFGNSNRINNKEQDSVPYSDHATGVTGMIGSMGHTTVIDGNTGNTRGILPDASFDNYNFNTSILKGEKLRKNVLQKILYAKPYLSNHSYGINTGWQIEFENNSNAGTGWYWEGDYDPNTKQSYNLYGTYGSTDRYLDIFVSEYPYMIIVKSAGNDFGGGTKHPVFKKFYYYSNDIGNINGYKEFGQDDVLPEINCEKGYDCIPMGAVAKNIITVGATEKIINNNGRYSKSTDVNKASYSSAGPRDDGAIKPDIAGVGSDVFHPAYTKTYKNGDGTSYSAPQVTGIIGLWLDIYRTLFDNKLLNAASAKTLLIHSAKEAGTKGPDVWYGWGFADAKKGAELLVDKSNNKIIFEDRELNNNTKDNILIETDGSQPIKVTISWLDPAFTKYSNSFPAAHNNRTSCLVNDLDLRVINKKTNQIYYPWKLDLNNIMAGAITGDNIVDNVEQVLIEKPEPGQYVIEISHKGNLINNDSQITSQKYSIIATGFKRHLSNDFYDSDNFSIYPTLLTDNDPKQVTISLSQKNIDSVEVYDMSGRLLNTNIGNGNTHILDFSSYNKGVYIVKIKLTSSSEPIVRKVLRR